MIIRKPYAFLMKHFRKIHILLLLFSVFVFYKTNTFLSFVKQYMNTKVYNPTVESVRYYASDFLFLVLLLMIAIIGIVIFLLKRKKKPILDYIAVLVEYIFVFIVFIVGMRYFNNLTGDVISARPIRLVRDLLSISLIPQYIVFVLFIIRILGIDLNRFGFKQDEEFNEISEDDREEVEVAVEFDKEAYKRQLKKRIRFLKYYYKENTFFINIAAFIVVLALIATVIGLINSGDKNVRQGDVFTANGYNIVINNSYISKYDLSGNTIEKNSSFLIVDVTVVNNFEKRLMDIERFLLLSNSYKYVPTLKYNDSFKDLGKGYVKNEFRKGSTHEFLLIYKISDKFLEENKVLYYQNIKGSFNYNYIKIKLKPSNLTKISNNNSINLGQKLEINKKVINISKYEVGDSYSYLHKECNEDGCYIGSSNVSEKGKKIIKLDLNTKDYDGSSFIDFLATYGKIVYRVDGKQKEIKIKNPIERKYNGDSSYFVVDSDVVRADKIYLSITVRNSNYIYYLKGGNDNEKVSK